MTEESADPPPCPECGEVMTRIAYGKPARAARERAARGEIILGGCIRREQRWGCRTCRAKRADDQAL
ncbi:hypothetical protein [Nocardia sp. NPDC056100]|uniref:hypothetical protein n=1 Tax=Nocardia sp. NPDC056100 TaxID=3345712 RepID=UPI0035E0C744